MVVKCGHKTVESGLLLHSEFMSGTDGCMWKCSQQKTLCVAGGVSVNRDSNFFFFCCELLQVAVCKTARMGRLKQKKKAILTEARERLLWLEGISPHVPTKSETWPEKMSSPERAI